MRVWIDLSNSPHPLLFAPVARELESRGHEVCLTVRDHAQTLELARERWPAAVVIGADSPGGRAAKARALARRVSDLRAWARTARPDVALSHNSYAQLVAARSAGVPAVTAMDFEHQPSNHLAFRLARTILLPEALPADIVRRQGATASKVVRYPGLKESLYVGDFQPDPDVPARLGLELGGGSALVVARTPPTGAIYHRFDNDLFGAALSTACGQPNVRCVVLTRFEEQRRAVLDLSLENCVVPAEAVDARSLMYAADLVIGAGGTMSREAALMGLPTMSLFAGREPAVDRQLIERGAMARLDNPAQLAAIASRPSPPHPVAELRRAGEPVLEAFVEATLALS